MSSTFSILERIEWAATPSCEPPASALCIFQYPRTDRMGCDYLPYVRGTLPHGPFSILERIEWAATPDNQRRRSRRRRLSVSSNGSNGLRRVPRQPSRLYAHGFQYPRTDRMGCDTGQNTARAKRNATFSILERIEWAATKPVPEPGQRGNHFQYPRTDRMGCDQSE